MLTEKLLTLRTHDLLRPQSNFYSVGAAPASSTEGRGLTLKMFKTHLSQFNSRLIPSVLDVFPRGPPDLVHHYFTVKVLFIFRSVLLNQLNLKTATYFFLSFFLCHDCNGTDRLRGMAGIKGRGVGSEKRREMAGDSPPLKPLPSRLRNRDRDRTVTPVHCFVFVWGSLRELQEGTNGIVCHGPWALPSLFSAKGYFYSPSCVAKLQASKISDKMGKRRSISIKQRKKFEAAMEIHSRLN